MSHIEHAAQALLEARSSGTPRGSIASEYALTDLLSAYAVQHALIARQLNGERPAGYKLGLTDARARAALGVAEPLRGVLLKANEYRDGATLRHADFIAPRLEIEVAMRLARDIEDPLTDRAELIAALEGVMPALEVCDSAFDGWPKSLADAVADNLSFGAHVLGQCVAADSVQLDDLPVALKLNGEKVGSGNTGSSMGNPLDAALWLINQMVTAGQHLRNGDVIMTGALAGMQPVAAGDLAEVEMGTLGSLSCRFSG